MGRSCTDSYATRGDHLQLIYVNTSGQRWNEHVRSNQGGSSEKPENALVQHPG